MVPKAINMTRTLVPLKLCMQCLKSTLCTAFFTPNKKLSHRCCARNCRYWMFTFKVCRVLLNQCNQDQYLRECNNTDDVNWGRHRKTSVYLQARKTASLCKAIIIPLKLSAWFETIKNVSINICGIGFHYKSRGICFSLARNNYIDACCCGKKNFYVKW